MGNVIHTDSPGKRREKILRLLATLLAQSDLHTVSAEEMRDKAAFVYLSLLEVEKSIDETVQPWEKREYWVKADIFREEWSWVKDLREKIHRKLSANDLQSIEQDFVFLIGKLASIEPLKRFNNPDFWKGAYKKLGELIHKE
ncbi:MAG: hypothetical protein FJZ98_09350 [Chloroflexi bacterium]|nr:hypothetical protein [Chloroflexota bacterium]